MIKLHVKVTQEHIDNGRRGHASSCPIAIALRDCDGRIHCPEVYTDLIELSFHDTPFYYPQQVCMEDINPVIAKFVTEFDSYQEVQPFEFDLELPINDRSKANLPTQS